MPLRGFEQPVLPHLNAGFGYARWLTRSPAEAEDVVQDACVWSWRRLPAAASASCEALVAARSQTRRVSHERPPSAIAFQIRSRTRCRSRAVRNPLGVTV